MNIGIYLYDNAEVLDFAGPFEVFATASRVAAPAEPFHAFLVSETGSVKARAGFEVRTNYTLADHPRIDVLIVAGGVHSAEMKKAEVLAWLRRQHQKARIVASVCTGVFILAAAGIVSNHRVTTHWQDLEDLRAQFPVLNVEGGKRWVQDGRLITSGGISAGIDMSLYLVSQLAGMDLAEKTARQMEYRWQKNG